MTELSKKFESLIKNTQKKMLSNGYLMPVKTSHGIMIGKVLITCNGALKNIAVNNEIIFENINLNAVAIRIANCLALKYECVNIKELYNLDQDYGKWFIDSCHLYHMYQKSLESKNYDQADIFQARYQDAKSRTNLYKNKALSLCNNAINKT